jgi:hypothetical protein
MEQAMPNSENIIVGRLAILPIAVAEWAMLILYFRALNRFHDSTVMRLCSMVLAVAAMFGMTLGQLEVYSRITSLPRPIDQDNFVAATLFLENVITIALGLYLAKKRSLRFR